MFRSIMKQAKEKIRKLSTAPIDYGCEIFKRTETESLEILDWAFWRVRQISRALAFVFRRIALCVFLILECAVNKNRLKRRMA